MAINFRALLPRRKDNAAVGSFAITPTDDTPLGTNIIAITISGAGTIAWKNWDGVEQETAALPAGTYLMEASEISATGTSATGITGWI